MNRILLTFKVSKLERQFCKDRTNHGNDFIRGYLVFLLAETIALSVIYSSQVNNSNLGLLVSAGAELLLGLVLRGLGVLFLKDHFNILVAIQNILQAILYSIIYSSFSDNTNSSPSPEQLAWSLGLLVKHIYLLLGSSFIVKIATASAIWATYFAQTISMDSGFHRDYSSYFLAVLLMGFILNGFRIYREDLSLRNMFLVQRSEEEMNFLVKKLLPVTMLITRYDKKEERVYFHMSNAKVQKNLNIIDNDTMKNFFMRVQLFSVIEDDSSQVGSLFQYLHLQAKQQAFKHFKRKPSQMLIPHTNNINNGANYADQLSFQQEKQQQQQQQQNHFINSMNNGFQSEDFLGPNNNFISPRQLPDELFSQRQSSIVAPDLQESMNNAFARATTMRKRKHAHKRTIIQQFDNLTQKNDTNYNNTAGNLNGNNNNNHNGGSSEGQHQPEKQFTTNQGPYETFTRQQTIKQTGNHTNTSSNNIPQANQFKQKDISDEVFDQLDVFLGVLQGDTKKIFNIKIYTYALEEIYQVIIFEDETLQGKVEFLTKLNKYCFGLFEQMLKKLRVPLASSLYQLKRAAANIRHSNFQSMRSRLSSRSNAVESNGLHLMSTDTSQGNNNLNHLAYSNQQAMNLPNIEQFSQQSQQNYWQQQLQQTFHAVSENNNLVLNASINPLGGIDSQQGQQQQQLPVSSNTIPYGDTLMQGSMIQKQLSSNMTYGMEPILQHAKSFQQQYMTEASDIQKKAVSTQENQALEEYVGIRENLAKKIEEMQFCNYGILNNLFNFSDVFHCFTKNTSLPFTAMNLSLERVIADLKSIFASEYRNRQLEIFFFNELTQQEQVINTNEKYLKQLLINLLNNSLSALSIQGKGYTAVHFKLDPTNKEVIDIYVMDSGPGFDEERQKEKRLILQNLNAITLEKNMRLKDLQIGLALCEKIVGRLGPYEHIKMDKNIIKVQIFRDYQNLFKKQDQVIQRNKSIFVKNRTALTEGNLEEDQDDEDSNYERNIIHSAVLKQQIIDRNEIVLSAKHKDYFQGGQ